MKLKLASLGMIVFTALVVGLSLEKPDPEALPSPEAVSSPRLIHHNVPFVAQAPFGDWKDRRQAYGCEETSALMAVAWAKGNSLTKEEALREIIASSEFQLEKYGYYEDTSAQDSLERIIKEYFKYENVSLAYDIDIEDIKNELAQNRVVLVPIDGKKINNPNYGVPYHMILITGYDDAKQEFTANDPGTRHGEKIRYSYETLANALSDYTSGNGKGELTNRTAMISVGRESFETR